MKTVDTHRWRYTERGRAKTTTFHCTWEHISAEHPDATPVEGTLIQRQEPEPADLIHLIGRGNGDTKVG